MMQDWQDSERHMSTLLGIDLHWLKDDNEVQHKFCWGILHYLLIDEARREDGISTQSWRYITDSKMKVRKDQYNNDTDVTVHYQLIDVGNRNDEYQLKDEGITKA